LEKETVSAIIPAYNEDDRVGETVKNTLPLVDEVIVVDDGSKDTTATEAEKAGARVVRLGRNVGKGYAVYAGFLLSKGEIILLLDADLGATAREAVNLLMPVRRGEVDMTIGVIPFRKGGFGFVLGLSRWGIRLLTGETFQAPIGGQRAMRREILESFSWERGFGLETALTIHALKQGFRLKEVPVMMEHRRTKRDWKGFLHRGRQFIHILTALFRSFLHYLKRDRMPL